MRRRVSWWITGTTISLGAIFTTLGVLMELVGKMSIGLVLVVVASLLLSLGGIIATLVSRLQGREQKHDEKHDR